MLEAADIVSRTLVPKLQEQGVMLHFDNMPTDETHVAFMRNYFEREVIPYVQQFF